MMALVLPLPAGSVWTSLPQTRHTQAGIPEDWKVDACLYTSHQSWSPGCSMDARTR